MAQPIRDESSMQSLETTTLSSGGRNQGGGGGKGLTKKECEELMASGNMTEEQKLECEALLSKGGGKA